MMLSEEFFPRSLSVLSYFFFLPFFFNNFIFVLLFLEFLFLFCLIFISNKETLFLSFGVIKFSSNLSIIPNLPKIFLIFSSLNAGFKFIILFVLFSTISCVTFIELPFEFSSFFFLYNSSLSFNSSSKFLFLEANESKISS